MFDFDQILRLAEVEPGHNLMQCFLLLMIWLSSVGLRKDIKRDREESKKKFATVDEKLINHEGRISTLETKVK